MQFKDVRPESYVKALRSDRCGLEAQQGEVEFHEFTCIDMQAGYGSIFGDGNRVRIDLCQHCLKLSFDPWLRVLEERRQGALLQELSAFDPERHGGEFPTSAANCVDTKSGLDADPTGSPRGR